MVFLSQMGRVVSRKLTTLVAAVLLLTLTVPTLQAQDYADHRSEQFATFGKDFWLCLPRTQGGMNQNNSMICIIAEHDCDVTFSNDRIGYSVTHHVYSHETYNPRLDTLNFFRIAESIARYADTLNPSIADSSQQIPFRPQNRGIHVTSTDTIAVLTLIYSHGSTAVTNILPTEMLRDEYVVEGFPGADGGSQMFDIIATEDSTTVDIVLTDYDWLGRRPGDTVTVTLGRGQLYTFQAIKAQLKYGSRYRAQDATTGIRVTARNHGFVTNNPLVMDTFIVDLTGTRIIARDCKRISVIEENFTCVPSLTTTGNYITPNGDNVMDQALPVRYAGKEYVVPNLRSSDTDYLRIVGLVDGTQVTVVDDSRDVDRTRTFTVNAGKCWWFQMDSTQGPFRITATQPVIVKEYTMGNNGDVTHLGDPDKVTIIPTEWWHSGPIHHHTACYYDGDHNRYYGQISTHVFTRTVDVDSLLLDNIQRSDHFGAITGTPFSYGFFGHNDYSSTVGKHDIVDTSLGYFYGICQDPGYQNHAVWNLPHLQHGGIFLKVNGVYADNLPEDTIRCLYDPTSFDTWSERPADSIFWDMGDGTVLAYDYDHGQHIEYTYADTGHYTVRRIITWRDESTEDCLGGKSCFTRTPDTAYAHLCYHNHYDTLIAVRQCEGSYTFRGHEFDYTDTFYVTSYWTESGCDTLFSIDLVTCPHCSSRHDTITTDDLPWTFQGVGFTTSQSAYPIYLPIEDTCDSIIYYSLTILRGIHNIEDSVLILAPNIITPSLETNNTFRVVASSFIEKAEVSIFDRLGTRLAQFDGLTGSWDATHDGTPVKGGTYVYYIRYVDVTDSGWKTMRGTVTVIR